MVQVHYMITSGKAWGRQAFDLELERSNQGPELIQELNGEPRDSSREGSHTGWQDEEARGRTEPGLGGWF